LQDDEITLPVVNFTGRVIKMIELIARSIDKRLRLSQAKVLIRLNQIIMQKTMKLL